MKKLFYLATVLMVAFTLSSCSSNDDGNKIVFRPASVELQVGQSTNVVCVVEGSEEGLENVYIEYDQSIIDVTSGLSYITITGKAAGTTTVRATLVTDNKVKGHLDITVK